MPGAPPPPAVVTTDGARNCAPFPEGSDHLQETLRGRGSTLAVCVKGVTRWPGVLCRGCQGRGHGRAHVSWQCWPRTEAAGQCVPRSSNEVISPMDSLSLVHPDVGDWWPRRTGLVLAMGLLGCSFWQQMAGRCSSLARNLRFTVGKPHPRSRVVFTPLARASGSRSFKANHVTSRRRCWLLLHAVGLWNLVWPEDEPPPPHRPRHWTWARGSGSRQ